jgi:nitrous oxide reductase accessory protein NosL
MILHRHHLHSLAVVLLLLFLVAGCRDDEAGTTALPGTSQAGT